MPTKLKKAREQVTLRGPQAGSVRPVLRLGTKSGLTEASSGQQGSSSSLVEHFQPPQPTPF